MSLKLIISSVNHLQGRHDRLIRATFREYQQETNIIRSVSKTADFQEEFSWPVARELDEEDTLELSLHNKSNFVKSFKFVGNVKIQLKTTIESHNLQIIENLVDKKNRIVGEIEIRIEFLGGQYFDDLSNISFNQCLIDIGNENDEWSNFGDSDSLFAQKFRKNLKVTSDNVSKSSIESIMESGVKHKSTTQDALLVDKYRLREYEITVVIHEAKQLTGLDVDPVFRIAVGDEKKYTSIKRSTNNPFYNEYFVFDLNESAATFYDKIITITALHSYNIPGRKAMKSLNLLTGRIIGQFKCDIATVYSAPSHQFHRKWAPLLHPKEQGDGAQGYVKCDLIVTLKGEIVKQPVAPVNEDKIDENLLVPLGLAEERARASYTISIHSATGVPRMDLGPVSLLRKKLKFESFAYVDAYVRVSFLGMFGETKIVKSYNPIWKQKITFYDMFPPLSNRIKIELLDRDFTYNDTIGTHYINLSQIMDPTSELEGLPTFGPTFVHFYGSFRKPQILTSNENLNKGEGEGCEYRGSVLMGLKVTPLDSNVTEASSAKVSKLTNSLQS